MLSRFGSWSSLTSLLDRTDGTGVWMYMFFFLEVEENVVGRGEGSEGGRRGYGRKRGEVVVDGSGTP